MTTEDNRKKAKQAYNKPKLRTIELAADEVLAIGCKVKFTRGFANPPKRCRIPRRCFRRGS